MNTRFSKSIVSVVLIAVLALGIVPLAGAQEGPKPEAVGLRPDAPTYAVHGPYWVGTRNFVIGENTDRPLKVTAWYPALNPEGTAEEVTYDVKMKDASIPADFAPFVKGHALRDATSDASNAPYPLVVFSHGFGIFGPLYANLTEHYASYGFVVLAPEHQEQYDPEYSDIWRSSIDRPRDIKQVLDYAETLTAAGGAMAGMIDMERVAVAGHSYGGYTALAMAGARYDLNAFNARCAALAPDDPNQFLCTPLVPREADMAKRAGLDPMPEGLWPSFGDPRVDVIIPMASDSYLFDQAGLAAITIPMMAMGGTLDIGTPFAWGAEPAFEYSSSEKKALVAFENADHMIFGAACSDAPFWGELGVYWGCMDSVWDKDRVQDLIHHFSTAFLLATLYGDSDAAEALAPDQVSFPGITYETTGF
jgi:predicted dienelactone hydrolase